MINKDEAEKTIEAFKNFVDRYPNLEFSANIFSGQDVSPEYETYTYKQVLDAFTYIEALNNFMPCESCNQLR